MAPSVEERAFDSIADDADLDLVEEALGYQASLLEGLRQRRWMAIGRAGPGEAAPCRLVPPEDCFDTTLAIHKGRLSAPNLSLERVVVLFYPPPAMPAGSVAEPALSSTAQRRDDVPHVANKEKATTADPDGVTKMGRKPIIDLLRAIARELRDDPQQPLAGLLQKGREAAVRKIARERHPIKFPKETTPSRAKVLEALAAEGV